MTQLILPSTHQERPYQAQALQAALEQFETGAKSTLVVMPTGTGKTNVAAMFAQEIARRRRNTGRTLFIAGRRILVKQAARTMKRMGLRVEVEMGQERARTHHRASDVVVGTVQTLQADRLSEWPPDAFDAIVSDECHHSLSVTWRKIYTHFPGAWHYGTTATAGRGDGKNLGKVFESKAFHYKIRNAIEDGWIVPIHPYTIRTHIDLRGINTTKGTNRDLNAGDLAERISPMIEELCRAVIENIGERQTVVYTPDVGSAVAVANMLNLLGTSARWVAGEGGKYGQNKKESHQHLLDFERLEYQVVVCCDLLTEGWDCEAASCVTILRPTLNPYRYTQMVGRGTRPCPELGKDACVVLDFDWITDDSCRDLCSPVDLFDDGEDDIPEHVLRDLRKKVKANKIDDVQKAVAEAADRIRNRPNLEMVLTGKKGKFSKYLRDPSGVSKILGVKLKARYDMDKNGYNPCTAAQQWKLRTLGVTDPEKMSKWGAIKLITALLKRQKLGLASPEEVQRLVNAGMHEEQARALKAKDVVQWQA